MLFGFHDVRGLAIPEARQRALIAGRARRTGARNLAITATTILAALATPTGGVWAQCTDNFSFGALNIPSPGASAPVQNLLPLGRGSSLSALTATINTVNTSFFSGNGAFVSAVSNPAADQRQTGMWSRAVGGTVETKTSSVGTLNLPGETGRQNCNTTIRQDYWGLQFGYDWSVLNRAGTGENLHFGLTGGKLYARTNDVTPGTSYSNPFTIANGLPNFTTAPGSMRETSEVPFIGLYGVYTKGGLFADTLVRWDFYDLNITDTLNGVSGQSIQARGLSVTGNLGYNIPLRNGWFIEPSGGFVWSRTSVGTLPVAGLLTTTNQPYARGTVATDDIDSLLGRASLRFGTTFTDRGIIWQPFASAGIFHEFSGDVTSRSLESGTGNPGIDGLQLTTVSKGGVGTYGQYAIGTAAVLGNSGWLGYVRGDYRQGEHIEGWGINVGLRFQFSPERPAPMK